ncbi:response regulator [Paraglaciecola aquimarina]|uniref:Response regulator n=1 Tax=Paraglaciecola algarum TaxID=3050085 RepID=A0ABS9D5R5_9ALTE|nr:response regulator [Paraglaciecola sp. G1-23]MCF2948245.1 response regulator [Paraglaciecola sp. G1-23]
MKNSPILIIEDSEIDQYIAKYMIKKFDENIDVLQAFDGQEALEVLTILPRQPVVILLDINMPRMNGHEFLKEYTASNIEKTSIAILTSSFQQSDKDQCLKFTCVKKYITKPFEVSDLNDLLSS